MLTSFIEEKGNVTIRTHANPGGNWLQRFEEHGLNHSKHIKRNSRLSTTTPSVSSYQVHVAAGKGTDTRPVVLRKAVDRQYIVKLAAGGHHRRKYLRAPPFTQTYL